MEELSSCPRNHPPFENITSRWGGMKTRYEFGPKIEKWLSAFEKKDQPLLVELLENFLFYSENRIKERVVNLYQLLKERCPDTYEIATYTKPFKAYGTSFSSTFFTSFWLNNNLKDYAEDNIIGLLSEGIVPPVIVIVDDYSGSGQTVIKTINRFLEESVEVTKSKIVVLLLVISETAEQNIINYASETKLSVEIVFLEKVSNAFKAGYIYNEDQALHKQKQYSELYDSLSLNPSFQFGFLGVASLIAFHYNTPNNTLGLFWQDLSDFCALFPRHKKELTTLQKLQSEAQNRRNRRRTVVISGLDEGRRSAMMAYCAAQGKKISLNKLQEDFGLTAEQLDSDIKIMLSKGYLEYNGTQFTPTAKLKSHLFVSRLQKPSDTLQVSSQAKDSFNPHDEYIPLHFNK